MVKKMARRRNSSKETNPVAASSGWAAGVQGMATAAAENKARSSGGGGKVFRFWIPKGESTEIIILDDQPTEFRHEHNAIGDSGKWDEFHNCVKATHGDHCPACQSMEKPSYYGMFLSVLDLSEYTAKNGDEVTFSRKLLCVKPFTFERWKKRIDRCIEDNGTLRGAVFELSRSSGNTSPATGDDLSFIEMDEDIDVEGSYVRVWTDNDGKKHEDDCSTVLDYSAVLPNETEEDLRRIFGTAAPAGSREAEADDGFDDDEDDVPFDVDEPVAETPAPTRRGRGRVRK